jgi:hypothetical protein
MIHKVEVSTDIGGGMNVTQSYESVCDTEEEAEEFGRQAQLMFTGFLNGWGESGGA